MPKATHESNSRPLISASLSDSPGSTERSQPSGPQTPILSTSIILISPRSTTPNLSCTPVCYHPDKTADRPHQQLQMPRRARQD
ncbi:hypothetical protein CgunFtcFv8_008750 [Champsocephalus gunnari]|uniref:Uncharacterized protein n=1 Tax=Champsocephalus gunnari TaxID=52237 RepID=A0AAN8D5P3_CHAGU|nr:hypothetical protein CgunFtcFv8_008750 [Champsocephalus gunnari]